MSYLRFFSFFIFLAASILFAQSAFAQTPGTRTPSGIQGCAPSSDKKLISCVPGAEPAGTRKCPTAYCLYAADSNGRPIGDYIQPGWQGCSPVVEGKINCTPDAAPTNSTPCNISYCTYAADAKGQPTGNPIDEEFYFGCSDVFNGDQINCARGSEPSGATSCPGKYCTYKAVDGKAAGDLLSVYYGASAPEAAYAAAAVSPSPHPSSPSPTPSTPSSTLSDCPIPNGTVACGSYFTPAVFGNTSYGQSMATAYGAPQCGHCGYGYPAKQYCSGGSASNSTYWGIDVSYDDITDTAKNAGKPFYLPTINGHVLDWQLVYTKTFSLATYQDSDDLGYAGTYMPNSGAPEKYYLYFHHATPHSADQYKGLTLHSGDQAGTICQAAGCGENHVMPILYVGDPQSPSFVDTAKYLCTKNTTNSYFDSSKSR